MKTKLFAGQKVRALRERRRWRLEDAAARLGVSVSYLSQVEGNQRPVTARVLTSIVQVYGVAPGFLAPDGEQQLVADLREAVADMRDGEPVGLSELRAAAVHAPGLARRFLALHRANHRLIERLERTDQTLGPEATAPGGTPLPYDEVRDFFHYRNNYIDELDRAAEALAEELGAPDAGFHARLQAYLGEALDVSIEWHGDCDLRRRYEPATRTLILNPGLPAATNVFQIALHVVGAKLGGCIDGELKEAGFHSAAAGQICRIALSNYAAGALLMPYRRFASAARVHRHDVEALAVQFGNSLEQVCHRLSNLQRPEERGVPIYFLRLDYAGNITKRHSATRLQFARFGGACPMWNVHEAVGASDRFLVQLAETPDRVRYLCVARNIAKASGSYRHPAPRYVLGFGCEAAHAHEFVYADGLDLGGPAVPIGVSCRICERADCRQRAFPPVDRAFQVPADERRTIPFSLEQPETQAAK